MHRDLKPENILFKREANGYIRFAITDFGLSKEVNAGETMRNTEECVGTRGYMDPLLKEKIPDGAD